LKSAESIASIMATRILGDIGSKILTMMLIFSVLAYVNVGLMSNPRVICAMSEDGTIPPFFSRYSKRFNVPVTSLITFTGISVLTLFFAKSFDVILNYVIFIDSIGLIVAAATLFILRKREPYKGNIYKMKLYPWIPLIFILSYVFVTYSVISASIDKDQGRSVLYGLCFFIGFLPLYFLFIFLKKRS
jgi:basic amino acid/polyamine antiporter, APA family